MPRKKWTPEEKKAWGEKMKAARELAKGKKVAESQGFTLNQHEVPTSHNVEEAQPSPEDVGVEEPSVSDLARQVQELKSYIATLQPAAAQQPQTAQVTQRGIVGETVRHSVNPKDYPDPRDRLFTEKKLVLQGFNRDWWDLEWIISTARYQTKDGLWYVEPKFQIKIIRIVPDPETNEPSAQRYVIHKGTFFEDPDAAIAAANQYGLEVPPQLEKTFLDEMRYLRMRDWVMESFYPPKPTQAKMNKRETVIGNRLVEVYEINSHESSTIPFNNLNKKL